MNINIKFFGETKLWPFLLAFVLAFAWLQPHHYPPWSGFHEDAMVSLWMAACGFAALLCLRGRVIWDIPSIALLLIAGVVWLQWCFGLILHLGQAILFSSVALGCALVWVLARHISIQRAQLVGDILFSALAIASLGSVGIAIYQWLGLTGQDMLQGAGLWIMGLNDSTRASANTAQPNETASLLIWGLLAGLWAYYRKAFTVKTLLVYGFFLVIGLCASQSRIGLLQMLLLTIGVTLAGERLGGRSLRYVFWILLILHIVLFWWLPDVLAWLGLENRGRSEGAILKDAARVTIYKMVFGAIMLQPWMGYGATHQALAQWGVIDQFPALNAYYMQSHNWMMDLLLWFGIPLGGMIAISILWWILSALRNVRDAPGLIYLLGVLTFALHASVELPHWQANVVLVAAAFGGCLSLSMDQSLRITINRAVMLFMINISLATTIVISYEYLRLERNFIQFRAEQLRVRTDISEVPDTFLLTHLADAMRMSRMSAQPHISPKTLDWMERCVIAAPTYHTQFTLAASLALNGQKDRALIWMNRANATSPISIGQSYQQVWKYFVIKYPFELGDTNWPELPKK